MKIRKHKNNKLFTFTVCRVDPVPMKGVLLRGKAPIEEKVTTLGKRQAVGSCWPSVRRGLLFGTDGQFTFHNVRETATVI
jgi:hypothetical protein